LIVEDQALIAMSLESYLEEIGIEICGSFSSQASALAWLNENTADVAIVDFLLQDGACFLLARELKQRNVHFVIYSGQPRPPDLPPDFQGVPWLEKPVGRETLLDAVLQGSAFGEERKEAGSIVSFTTRRSRAAFLRPAS
jgi:two-component SAPR family response regulator